MDHQEAAAGGGAGVAMEMTSGDGASAGPGVKLEDDELTLGAEAKLMTPPKDVVLSRTTKSRLAEVGAASGRSRQSAWREMFSSIKTESFNSEGSTHSYRTWDSIDQLINERSTDPEEVLNNLGFQSQEPNESLPTRIPDRFLRHQSVASGVSVEKFINSNPDLKEYVALTRSLSEPSTTSLVSGATKFQRASSQSLHTHKSMADFVKTVMLIRYFEPGRTRKQMPETQNSIEQNEQSTARAAEQCSGDDISALSCTSNQAIIDEPLTCRNMPPPNKEIQREAFSSPPISQINKIPSRFSYPDSQSNNLTLTPSMGLALKSLDDTQDMSVNRGPTNIQKSEVEPVKMTPTSPSLHDAGNELLEMKSMINISCLSQYPDIPRRFFLHHTDSVMNSGFTEESSATQCTKRELSVSLPSHQNQHSEHYQGYPKRIKLNHVADNLDAREVSDTQPKAEMLLPSSDDELMKECCESVDDLGNGIARNESISQRNRLKRQECIEKGIANVDVTEVTQAENSSQITPLRCQDQMKVGVENLTVENNSNEEPTAEYYESQQARLDDSKSDRKTGSEKRKRFSLSLQKHVQSDDLDEIFKLSSDLSVADDLVSVTAKSQQTSTVIEMDTECASSALSSSSVCTDRALVLAAKPDDVTPQPQLELLTKESSEMVKADCQQCEAVTPVGRSELQETVMSSSQQTNLGLEEGSIVPGLSSAMVVALVPACRPQKLPIRNTKLSIDNIMDSVMKTQLSPVLEETVESGLPRQESFIISSVTTELPVICNSDVSLPTEYPLCEPYIAAEQNSPSLVTWPLANKFLGKTFCEQDQQENEVALESNRRLDFMERNIDDSSIHDEKVNHYEDHHDHHHDYHDQQEQEGIYQEQLIDDNVLDPSLSDHSYLSDLLEQIEKNQRCMKEQEMSPRHATHTPDQLSTHLSLSKGPCWDIVSDAPLENGFTPTSPKETHCLVVTNSQQSEGVVMDMCINDTVGTGAADMDSEGGAGPDVMCSDDLCGNVASAKKLREPIQYSFDLEEISSEDFHQPSQSSSNHDKPHNKDHVTSVRRITRGLSGQSDSSGYVEMEFADCDARDFKIPSLGSSISLSDRPAPSTTHIPQEQSLVHQDLPPHTMGLINSTITEQSGDLNDKDHKPKSDSHTEKKHCAIINNGHSITHKDLFFGAQTPRNPERLAESVTSSSSTRTPVRSSRRHQKQTVIAPPPQWVSRMYIDPPVAPEVTLNSKMEVKLMIEQGHIKDIENARAVPMEKRPGGVQRKRAVSYLHLSVSQKEGDFQIRPVDKGDFTLPQFSGRTAGSPPLDVSQHQVLCTMLNQPSIAWAPDAETSRQCSLWNAGSAAATRRQDQEHHFDEVKLIQHAITKFKVEFRVLDLRTKAIYAQSPESLNPEQRSEMATLGKLRSQIQQEIKELERHLGDRLGTLFSEDAALFAGDLASLTTVRQTIDLLEEQVYHTSVVHGLSELRAAPGTADPASPLASSPASRPASPGASPPAAEAASPAPGRGGPAEDAPPPAALQHLTVLRDALEEHRTRMAAQLGATMEQMRQALLVEVRNSVRAEMEGLQKQILNPETEVSTLKDRLPEVLQLPQRGFHVPGGEAMTSPPGTAPARAPAGTSGREGR